jgi:hypothetical protein
VTLLLLFNGVAIDASVTMAAGTGTLVRTGQDVQFVLASPATTSAITPKMGGWHGKRQRFFNPWEDREEDEQIPPEDIREAVQAAIKADLIPEKPAPVERFRRPSGRVSWVDLSKSQTAVAELKLLLAKAEIKAAEQDEDDVADALAVLMEMFD